MSDRDRGHRFFAWFFTAMAPGAERRGSAKHRRRLLAGAEGRVVEIGAGIGLNLPYYPEAVSEVVATEPDPHMLKRLRRALGSAGVPVRIERAPAEELPLEDEWADTAVATLVLCSVPDQAVALAEIMRVLRPGGRLLFYEHVRSEDLRLARRQDRWERPWGVVGAGCHPNRDTVAAIRAAGFELEEVDRLDVPGSWLATPHALGCALRP